MELCGHFSNHLPDGPVTSAFSDWFQDRGGHSIHLEI